MGRKNLKEPRQKEIVQAFYRLAKKEGLENASIAKTADLIKVNPSLIMHYFKTKDYLVYGLIEFILDKYLLIYKLNNVNSSNPKVVLNKIIDNIFSKKWNTLFDDGVSYSCYSLTFRNKIIRQKYKILLDTLRKSLEESIVACNKAKLLSVKNPSATADLIFILADGAYYYLSLVDNRDEYMKKLSQYKKQAIKLLQRES
jgi:AcrR family transcriptional regulator